MTLVISTHMSLAKASYMALPSCKEAGKSLCLRRNGNPEIVEH